MQGMIRRKVWLFIIFPLFLGIVPGLNMRQAQATGETMYDYTKLPAFLETGLNPNLLLLIDNSKSMYDPAYVDDEGIGYCYVQDTEDKDLDGVLDAGEDINKNGVLDKNYDNTVAYPGYFSPLANIWYEYDLATGRFTEQSEAGALLVCSGEDGTKYTSNDMCITVDSDPDPDLVTAFAAKGRFLNWLTASKFDIEKEILTGGKYDATNDELVLESRGCLGKRYIKKATVYKDGVTATNYYATFGVRPPSEAEKEVDKAYNSGVYTDSSSNTRIEIFKVDTNGFDPTACTAAIDEFITPPPLGGRLGTIQTQTSACLGVASDSAVVFNQSMQECWFYNKFGRWQNPQNTVDQLKRKCEAIYNVPLSPPAEAWEAPPADYVAPETLVGTDVCSGLYDPSLTDLDEWGTGYVGQCWEPDNTIAKVDNPCSGATASSGLNDPADLNAAGNYHYCDGTVWKECVGNYHRTPGSCTSGGWQTERIDDPAAPPPGTPSLVGWTDDADPVSGVVIWDSGPPELSGDFDGAEHCISGALAKFCENTGEATVVDPSDTIGGGAVGQSIPSILIDYAAVTQLGEPLAVLTGRVRPPLAPVGLVHEFKYNLRLGAMVFNDGTAAECRVKQNAAGNYVASLFDCLVDKDTDINSGSLPDSTKLDGGRIIAYIDEGQSHTIALAQALNDVNATTWTPTAEALFNAVGYYTQDAGNDLRINPPTSNAATLLAGDFIRDADWGLTLGPQDKNAWSPTGTYLAGDIVYTSANKLGYTKLYRAKNGGTSSLCSTCSYIEEDKVVKWMAYDPVLAGCQSNNILLITDGASTADVETGMVSFVTGAGHNDSDTASTWTPIKLEPGEYECKEWIDADYDGSYDVGETIVDKYFGSTLLDDVTAYGNSDSTIFYHSTIATVDKNPIKTHIVVAGSLRDDGTSNECNSKTILEAAATNGGTTLVQAADPADLEGALRNVFEAIGGEVSSGSAASVISHSRSGEGAIYQAIFYPKQVDAFQNEVDWTGDVHSLWLDAAGHIREDCGVVDCTTPGDGKLDPSKDYIIEFYTDSNGSARARRFSDADGDGNYDNSAACSDPTYTNEADCLATSGNVWSYAANPDFVAGDILLKDLHYLWSAASWLAEASGVSQRAYDSIAKERYIFTMLDDTGTPTIVPFTKAALAGALTADEYNGYFNAVVSLDPSLNRTADGIVDYIRGVDQPGYRSREIDWTDSVGLETVKLGDIIQSTPTLVSAPAENYDVIYGDPTYRQFRKKHQYRRAVVYAGGNDGGLHAFNSGYYDRFNKQFLKAPPDDLQASPLSFTKKEYDLGAELWMYVPKNIFPHLRWLTDEKYGDGHVYYIDAKPYIFDAKIFNPDADIHIGGWGTILVAGMRYGGGNIGVDTDGDGVDDEIMRSSFSILDITDPEYPPVVLAEFTDADLGFTTGSPTAIPMLRCDKNTLAGIADCNTKSWPMDWYLAFGSGPHATASTATGGPQAAMRGVSDQTAQLYVMKLGGTDTTGTPAVPATLDTIGSGQVTSGVATFDTQPSLVTGYPISSGACSNFTSANEAACLAAGQVWNPVSCKFIPGVWDTFTTSATCLAAGKKWDWWWGLNTGKGCYESISAEACLASDGLWSNGSNNLGVCSDSRDTSENQCLYWNGTWKDTFPDSFFGDFIAVDYDLSFQTESLYFGSVSDTKSAYGHEEHGGALHRLVINDDPDPTNWRMNLFYDTMSPVTAAPSVATDGERAWVYFGTGRLFSAKEDKKILSPTYPTMFLGLKEHYGDDGIMNLDYPNGGRLVDVTGVWVAAGGALSPTPITASNAHTTAPAVNLTDTTGFVTTFAELNLEMGEPDIDATNGEKDIYHGWKIRLAGAERVIGQPAILGDVVTFTSYIPSNDPCLPEGDSYLWAPYFRTGTAYSRSVIGLKDRSGTPEVLRKIDLGKGLSTTPNIHTGAGDGSKAFVQSSTGAILSIEQTNPGVVKSGMQSWRELGGNRSCN